MAGAFTASVNAFIKARTTQAYTASAQGSRIAFGTNPTGTAGASDTLFIESDGSVTLSRGRGISYPVGIPANFVTGGGVLSNQPVAFNFANNQWTLKYATADGNGGNVVTSWSSNLTNLPPVTGIVGNNSPPNALNAYMEPGNVGVTIQWGVTVVSDRRLKRNVAPATIDALGIIQRLPVYSCDVHYPTISEERREHWDCSLMADDVAVAIPRALAPEALRVGGESYAGLREMPLVITLIRAVQQLAARLEMLEAH